MKKVLILVLFTIFLSGCGNSQSIVSDSTTQAEIHTMFEHHSIDAYYSILVDKETGVCYLEYSYKDGMRWGVYSITVMLNPDGTPKIWEGYEKE